MFYLKKGFSTSLPVKEGTEFVSVSERVIIIMKTVVN
jgi:hypothetical protein